MFILQWFWGETACCDFKGNGPLIENIPLHLLLMQYVGVHAFVTQSVFIPSAQPFLTCRPWQIGQVIVAVPALGCPKVSQGELTRHGQTSLPCLTQFGFFVNNWEHINTVLRRL